MHTAIGLQPLKGFSFSHTVRRATAPRSFTPQIPTKPLGVATFSSAATNLVDLLRFYHVIGFIAVVWFEALPPHTPLVVLDPQRQSRVILTPGKECSGWGTSTTPCPRGRPAITAVLLKAEGQSVVQSQSCKWVRLIDKYIQTTIDKIWWFGNGRLCINNDRHFIVWLFSLISVAGRNLFSYLLII